MASVINVRAERNDRRDLAALCLGGREENGDVGVACKVAAAADAVHHLRSHDMGGVDISVDIDLDCRVHRDDAETADNLRIIRDLLRTEHHDLLVLLDVLVEALEALRRRRERRAGCRFQLACIRQIEHAVLDNLGVDFEIREIGVDKSCNNSICHVADAGLQRQEALRHTPFFDLLRKELNRKFAHPLRSGIERRKRTRLIRDVRGNNVLDLVQRARDEVRTDTVARLCDGNGQAIRRIEGDVNVVHADKFHRLARVHLDDHHIRTLDE